MQQASSMWLCIASWMIVIMYPVWVITRFKYCQKQNLVFVGCAERMEREES